MTHVRGYGRSERGSSWFPSPVYRSIPSLAVAFRKHAVKTARMSLRLLMRPRSIALALGGLLLLGLVRDYAPDLPRQMLIAKYGAAPSKFARLGSGAWGHYRDQGDASKPVLLLVHGSNSSLHTWEPWVAALGREFRTVSLDLPGHGLTGSVPGDDYSPEGMVAFVHEFAHQLGLSRFTLAGNSMGGHIAWRYALKYAEDLEALVLVDAAGVNHLLPSDQQPSLPLGMRLTRTPGVNFIAQFLTPRRFVEKAVKATFHNQRFVTAQMVDRYYELLRFPGNRRATRLRAAARVDLSRAQHLNEIRTPTLILWGDNDKLIPVAAARLFAAKIPNATLVVYHDVGHIPMEEVAQRSAADLQAFLHSKSGHAGL
jgi:pimeloyl-ACP methyl ester carboxylesterase